MKLCVIFPGIGYHCDKPLLYYAKKIAKNLGYDILEITYKKVDGDILHDLDCRKNAIDEYFKQVNEQLSNVEFDKYSKVLFISKSIGTTLSSMVAKSLKCNVYSVLYTPIQETFDYLNGEYILFHGTKDPWLKHSVFEDLTRNLEHPYYIYDNCNHSLECDDVLENLRIMKDVMFLTNHFLMEIENEQQYC